MVILNPDMRPFPVTSYFVDTLIHSTTLLIKIRPWPISSAGRYLHIDFSILSRTVSSHKYLKRPPSRSSKYYLMTTRKKNNFMFRTPALLFVRGSSKTGVVNIFLLHTIFVSCLLTTAHSIHRSTRADQQSIGSYTIWDRCNLSSLYLIEQ